MPFKVGNDYGKRSRLFERAVQKAVEEDRTALDRIAKHLIAFCLDPDAQIALPAINLLANRLDGKPYQIVDKNVSHTVNTGDASSLRRRLESALDLPSGALLPKGSNGLGPH